MSISKNNKLLFQLNHPSHFHLFKNTISELESRGHEILISIKEKDILKNLLKGFEFVQITNGYRKKNLFSIVTNILERDKKLFKIVKEFQPDILLGTSPEIGHISNLARIPALFWGEDDVDISKRMFLAAMTCYPFFNNIVSPLTCNNSIWNKKTIFYNGFQKLAYLHPNWFTPDRDKVNIEKNRKFFFLRFTSLTAYHDANVSGISNEIAYNLINILTKSGEVVISSERKLPPELEKYRFRGNVEDIHHYLFYADLYIGDSQSMAVEAAMLGTVGFRFNGFVGRISVLEELEKKYKLSIGIDSSNPDLLFDKVRNTITSKGIQKKYSTRRQRLLEDKIDVTAFMVWLIENYPESAKIMKKTPDYQKNFK